MEMMTPTKLEYHDQMLKLQSKATFLFYFKGDDGRKALILDSTIFHPQGGGQPSDTGFICVTNSNHRFCVQDVRSKDGVVFHYGVPEDSSRESELEQGKGKEVFLLVDESRRRLNSRPFVEYKGTVPPNELQSKQREIEIEVNSLISKGGKVYATVLPYEEAAQLCGGSLPDYIPQGSNPRIIKLGDNPGCPCGGTHVSDISEIASMKVSRIRMKKGMTKVFYTIGT
ncbi:hypothetical protein CRYUN_Cryun18bG0015700 [Craigia yunnanensis]